MFDSSQFTVYPEASDTRRGLGERRAGGPGREGQITWSGGVEQCRAGSWRWVEEESAGKIPGCVTA